MENTSAGPVAFLKAKGPLSQIVLAVIIATVLYIILLSLEIVYISYLQVANTKVDIEGGGGKTINSGTSKVYTSNTNDIRIKNGNFRDLRYSDNEKTGIEYSYSCFLNISPETFKDGTTELKHVFHKGSEKFYPLLSPGVFVLGNTNTLRVFQNTSTTWYNYIDIPNMPIGKWFHLVVLVKNNATEIYINGNLGAKLSSGGGVVYQNYQNLYLFNKSRISSALTQANMLSIPEGETYNVNSSVTGSISQFYYFSYALSYTEIQDMLTMGPNPVVADNNVDKPPYFLDNWWTGKDNLM